MQNSKYMYLRELQQLQQAIHAVVKLPLLAHKGHRRFSYTLGRTVTSLTTNLTHSTYNCILKLDVSNQTKHTGKI